jgi:hypothetical protein
VDSRNVREAHMIESAKRLVWRKARRCATGTCVEVARDGDRYFVRDSKDPQAAPLEFTPAEWATFVAGVQDGDFDF